ncbi:tetratricopeptide repeat protein [Flavobacterium selenitireducens]|uniref:tetratricopeptide repeat protein n=1 Tax=Flavobacterium selenitireducens TaxID=2722704 RepID=UPI00168AA1D4|nr:tetratricopeptide repeat protein [Flavobacterium selenitireducens]MBD3582054.1 tetratricopeptide repeat protein [Flavobacterium selenitireducens]
MKKLVTYGLLIFGCAVSFAQEEVKEEKDKFLPKGNEAYSEKNYAEAEADFRVSQSKFPKKAAASYNLGNSIYTQKHQVEAGFAYGSAIKNAITREEKHKAWHNMGNVLMNMKDYQGAVNAYKNALVNNPKDDETRYNYALARKMLKDNPPKPNDKKKDKDKEKDKDKKDKDGNDNKDKNKQDNKDGNKDKKDNQQNQDQQGGNKPQQRPKPQQGQGNGISGQRIENLLDAVNHEEKKVQDKVKAQQVKGKPVRNEKDW